jgi:hypothetical protein
MKYVYLHAIRWSSSSIVKRTKCEINDFSIVFSAKTVSWTSFTLRFYQLFGDFLQVIRWQFSRWLQLKIANGRVERDRLPVFANRHFVPGPVVGSRRPWARQPFFTTISHSWLLFWYNRLLQIILKPLRIWKKSRMFWTFTVHGKCFAWIVRGIRDINRKFISWWRWWWVLTFYSNMPLTLWV